MKFKQLTTLLIALIGYYSIFSAIVTAMNPVIYLLLSPFVDDGLMYAGIASVSTFTFLVLPLVFGILLVRNSTRLSNFMIEKIDVDKEESIEFVSYEVLSFVLITTLGLYMLVITIPDALSVFALWFQTMAAETGNYPGLEHGVFWRDRIPDIVYHITSIGFAAFIFFKGKSISKFVSSLKKQKSHKT